MRWPSRGAVGVGAGGRRRDPARLLRWPIAGVLVSLGVLRFFRHRHPRWAGMRVGMGGLTVWSFLMATAHGAGLMVVPVFMGMSMADAGGHAHHMPARRDERGGGAPRHRPARGGLSGGDGVRRGGGVREARRRHPAARLVQPRSDLGGALRRHRRDDADGLARAHSWRRATIGSTRDALQAGP